MEQPGEQLTPALDPSARSEQRILSVTRHGKSASSVEEILRRRIEEISQAIRHKDIDRLMTFYVPDVVAFDVRPPLEARGVADPSSPKAGVTPNDATNH